MQSLTNCVGKARRDGETAPFRAENKTIHAVPKHFPLGFSRKATETVLNTHFRRAGSSKIDFCGSVGCTQGAFSSCSLVDLLLSFQNPKYTNNPTPVLVQAYSLFCSHHQVNRQHESSWQTQLVPVAGSCSERMGLFQ